MNERCTRRWIATLTFVAALTAAPALHAAAIYVNSSQATVGPITSSAGQARYLLSHTNYDQNIFNGVGSLNSANIVTRELGNVNTLNNRPVTFTLENRPGQGIIFTLSSPATSTRAAILSTLAWGNFSDPVSGSVSTIDGRAPGTSFNVISIFGQASRANASLAFDNLSFSSPTATVADGALYNGIASRDASNSNTGQLTGSAPAVAAFSAYTQTIASTADLSLHAFTLSGLVTGLRDASGSGSASVAFSVNLGTAEVTLPVNTGGSSLVMSESIPEPATASLALGAAAALLMRRRLKRPQRPIQR